MSEMERNIRIYLLGHFFSKNFLFVCLPLSGLSVCTYLCNNVSMSEYATWLDTSNRACIGVHAYVSIYVPICVNRCLCLCVCVVYLYADIFSCVCSCLCVFRLVTKLHKWIHKKRRRFLKAKRNFLARFKFHSWIYAAKNRNSASPWLWLKNKAINKSNISTVPT